jgi:hypothetical protein
MMTSLYNINWLVFAVYALWGTNKIFIYNLDEVKSKKGFVVYQFQSTLLLKTVKKLGVSMFFIEHCTEFSYSRNPTWAGHADCIVVCKHQQNRLCRALKLITEDHIKLCQRNRLQVHGLLWICFRLHLMVVDDYWVRNFEFHNNQMCTENWTSYQMLRYYLTLKCQWTTWILLNLLNNYRMFMHNEIYRMWKLNSLIQDNEDLIPDPEVNHWYLTPNLFILSKLMT